MSAYWLPRYYDESKERIGALMPDGRLLELKLKRSGSSRYIEGGLKYWPSIESTGVKWELSESVCLTEYDMKCETK